MRIVFVVLEDICDPSATVNNPSFRGVYTTKELAQKAIEHAGGNGFNIEECELDSLNFTH